MLDEFTEEFGRQEVAEARLVQARASHHLAYALVMAALSWDKVDGRGWCSPEALCEQARQLMTAERVPAAPVGDLDAVATALTWATRDPALLESDGHGRYRPVFGTAVPVGSRHWRERCDEAAESGVLTPLELVCVGDSDHYARPADLDAADVSYRLAAGSSDPDASALASLRLAEIAEARHQPAEAATRYAEVAALRHPVASPPAELWLAQRAAEDGDPATARALAQQVIATDDERLLRDAWDLLASLAWAENDRDAAIAAMRAAVDTAGAWHGGYSRRLAAMLAASGDLSGAADVHRALLEHPLHMGTDAHDYARLMTAAGRGDEAIAVLEERAASDGVFTGEVLLAAAAAHAARDDTVTARQALARAREHWSAQLPQVAVRADVIEAALATADGEDERAAALYRSLTDSDDAQRRDLTRPLLIATGEHLAAGHRPCVIPGIRPLLEYLCEAAPPATAGWAASSLAHLAIVQDRPADAEAAVRLAARHLDAAEITALRTHLLHRAGRDDDALRHVIDAADEATAPTLTAVLETVAELAMRGVRPDAQQRIRLRASADRALFTGTGTGTGHRQRLAFAMAHFEYNVWFDRERAADLWAIAAEGDDAAIAAPAWFSVGLMEQVPHPIGAVHAFEQAMLLGDPALAGNAATALVSLAERLGDQRVVATTCARILDFADGDGRAKAALRLGQFSHYKHPDDAEDAYIAAATEPGAQPGTVGAALAWLGALHALHGNRRLAQQAWRRGRRHRDPQVAEAFAAERAVVGRVNRL